MKALPKMEISAELEAQITEGMQISELCKADVVRQLVRQAFRIGLPQFAARFRPLWLEERLREALAETAEPITLARFRRKMKSILNGG